MREIKFRAWDNVKNEMYYAGEEDYILFSLTSGGILGEDVSECGFQEDETEILEHLKYMQYTGLKDKNGKEIYEGDILQISELRTLTTSINGHYEVLWQAPCFVLTRKNENALEFASFVDSSRYEVIGNIYENPELIKQPK